MVMETPSPQCVGREFVRQYYTLLNEAPLHLHRFYSHNSSFVHGGVEKPGEEQPPVMGQAEIHKKIMSLNFRDCHAKIRQVDSQATVGNAVVVQVTGELSNSGQPMRRFMQTFVLAPQSPKKYYVHNDIFRYQDEVFHDNDSDMENLEEGLGDEIDSDLDPVDLTQDHGQEPVQQFFDASPQLSNGTHDDRVDTPSPSPEEEDVKEEPINTQTEEIFDLKEEETLETQTEEAEPDQSGQMTIQFMETKTFSWAGIASKNATSSSVPSITTSPPFGKVPQSLSNRPEKTDIGASAPGSGPQPQRQTRPPRDNRPRERERVSMSRDDGDSDSQSGRPRSRFPDSHQLFVGNLPHNITEKELEDFFTKFGHVVELRINTKSSGGKLPVSNQKNFGFVIFDSPEPVQSILSQKPIKYNGEHRLNVEEKKPRGGAPGGGRGGPPRGGMGGGRGGTSFGSGGRGGIRGSGGGPGPRSDRGSMGGRGGMSGPRR
ncbi:ras GTPase-activating protein-binding protein 2-like isoform X1 [Mytilus edulis]|uniref:ras GTPase-activating protein-binding protein 2-like isoform X1 n=1 Tax=Mytilus edulis TaxID=6550 RepID=UPI0039EEA954